MRRLLRAPAAGYYKEMIEEIRSSQPEVEASKSEKRLLSYGHLKICIISHQFWVYIDVFVLDNKRRRHLLVAKQPPTSKNFDIPEGIWGTYHHKNASIELGLADFKVMPHHSRYKAILVIMKAASRLIHLQLHNYPGFLYNYCLTTVTTLKCDFWLCPIMTVSM